MKTICFAIGVFCAFVCPPRGSAQVLHHVAAANIVVVQNDTNNTTASVTVTTPLSINDFRIRPGSNRGDYNVQIGSVSTDDVANGILVTSINQNGRDNGELDAFPGMNYGTCSIDSGASGSPGSSGEYFISVFQAPNNAEYNFNVAAAWFPYNEGWYGGWLNNASGLNSGPNNHLIGNTNLVLGTHVLDLGSGKTKVDLRDFGLDCRSNAVLIAEGGKNEANFALSATNSDGTWTITCHDDNGGTEQDYVAFVCVPLTNHTVVSGRFIGDTSIALQSQPFNVNNTGIGTYHLSIPGVNPTNGVLIISPESGGPINGDNMVNYQLSGDGWDIQTRDVTKDYTPQLQELDNSNAVVSFVFIPGPTPGSTALRWYGAPTTNWDFSLNQVWRMVTNSAPTNYFDGCQLFFDDSGSNSTINLSATVAPYQMTVSSVLHDYFITGNGSIVGPGGLAKQGSGKLTFGTSNNYVGDTIISGGTLALRARGAVPGGPGRGKTVVNSTLDLGGFDCTLNNLSGVGTVDNAAAGGPTRLTIFQTTSTGFSGVLKNTTGSLSLILDGGGTLTLSSANTFSGGVIVSNGTLVVNGTAGSGPVAVQSNSHLAGTGSIAGPVTMAPNSSLDLKANAPLSTGTLTLNGDVTATVTAGVSLSTAGTYLLLNHGTLNGAGSFKLVQPPGLQANGFTASLNDSGTQLKLTVTTNGITGTIADVRHVVMLMVENRSFDHYFGSTYGVRGFNDRNALLLNNGSSVFYQPSNSSYELPFHTTLQCLTDLNHSWPVTHSAINEGKADGWIENKGAETMCFYQRSDLPYHYALADAFTICDEYHCCVLASSNPNRTMGWTGTIDPNGAAGGPLLDNDKPLSGLRWKTYAEMLQQAGISWKIYQVAGNSGENVLPSFATFMQATPGNPLYDRGRAGYSSLTTMINGFAADVANNTLPIVSWIVSPGDHSSHPPESSASCQYLLKHLLDGLAANPQVYRSTVFIFHFDENDGFFDHAMPILPPAGTPNEFVGSSPIGLGIRVPAIIVSPWTRGGRVCSQVFDHTSLLRFLELWTGVLNPNISSWRRQVCGDLTSAFDFAHPNTNFPSSLPSVAEFNCGDGTTPDVPSPQTIPTQEIGSRVPLPLPYQPNARCALNTSGTTFTLIMTNWGAAPVHFGVYANAYRTDGPWQFDVNTTNSASMTFSASGLYDFSCYGPNGFQRRFAGNITADFQKIEAVSILNPVNGGIKIELDNATVSNVTFTVTNGYTSGSATYPVPAHTTNLVNVGSETNNGFYDVTVTASADSLFLRRFLGRVETYIPPTVSSGKMLADGTFQFAFNGPAGQPYRVLANTNLLDSADWTTVLSGIFGAQPAIFIETNIPSRPARFYRLASP